MGHGVQTSVSVKASRSIASLPRTLVILSRGSCTVSIAACSMPSSSDLRPAEGSYVPLSFLARAIRVPVIAYIFAPCQ
eukprot:9431614-Pyramimonas_sp.AAC.1